MNVCSGAHYDQYQMETDSFLTCLQNCKDDPRCVSFTHEPEKHIGTTDHTQGKCFYYDHRCGGGPYLPLNLTSFSCSQEACSIDSFSVLEGKQYNSILHTF